VCLNSKSTGLSAYSEAPALFMVFQKLIVFYGAGVTLAQPNRASIDKAAIFSLSSPALH
jgi:hypothetical protein